MWALEEQIAENLVMFLENYFKMKNWSLKKLGQVADFTNGGAWTPDEYVESGIPVVRVSDIHNETTIPFC